MMRTEESHSDSGRVRWVAAMSAGLVGPGGLVLVLSWLPPEEARVMAGDWHLVTHPANARVIPGLVLQPGPEAATLAADLAPVGSPASIVAIAVSSNSSATPPP